MHSMYDFAHCLQPSVSRLLGMLEDLLLQQGLYI